MEDQTEKRSINKHPGHREGEHRHPDQADYGTGGVYARGEKEQDELTKVEEVSPDQNAHRYHPQPDQRGKIQEVPAKELEEEEKNLQRQQQLRPQPQPSSSPLPSLESADYDHPVGRETSTTTTTTSTSSANKQPSLREHVMSDQAMFQLLHGDAAKAEEVPATEHHEAESWMVAVDGSEESEWAFNDTLNRMDLNSDILYVLSIAWKRVSEEDVSRKVLLKFARIAEKCQVKNCHLLLGMHRDVPEAICHIAKALHVKTLVLGHRQHLSWLEKTFSHSVSKQCVAQSQCSVTVVRHPTQIANSVLVHAQDQQPFSRTFGVLSEEEAERRRPGPEEEVTEILMKQLVVGEKTYQVQIFLEVLGKKA